MEKEMKLEEAIDDKKKILIGIINLVGITIFTVVGLIIKNILF